MVSDVGGVEDGCDIGQGLQAGAAGFVIDYANALCAIRERNQIDAVNDSTNLDGGQILSFRKHSARGGTTSQDVFERKNLSTFRTQRRFEGEDGEGGEAAVYLEELAEVFDDDFAVDELETVQRGHLGHRVFNVKEFEFYRLIDSTLNLDLGFDRRGRGYPFQKRPGSSFLLVRNVFQKGYLFLFLVH